MTSPMPPERLGKKSNLTRAALFASFDALEVCKTEHSLREKPSENDPYPEKFKGPEFEETAS